MSATRAARSALIANQRAGAGSFLLKASSRPTLIPMPQSAFTARKERILQQLSVPEDEYDDLSPKGSVDEGIRPLIANINDIDGLVTTSSCAGRVSIYLDGGNNMATPSYNTDEDVIPRSSASGGKGGGRWLFVSHDPLHIPAASGSADHHFHSLFGLKPSQDRISEDPSSKKFIHFKFEAMVRHLELCAKCAYFDCFEDSAYIYGLPRRRTESAIRCPFRWVSRKRCHES